MSHKKKKVNLTRKNKLLIDESKWDFIIHEDGDAWGPIDNDYYIRKNGEVLIYGFIYGEYRKYRFNLNKTFTREYVMQDDESKYCVMDDSWSKVYEIVNGEKILLCEEDTSHLLIVDEISTVLNEYLREKAEKAEKVKKTKKEEVTEEKEEIQSKEPITNDTREKVFERLSRKRYIELHGVSTEHLNDSLSEQKPFNFETEVIEMSE